MREKLSLPERPSSLFLLAVIDLLVLLLVFFLLVTSAVQQAGMAVNLPSSSFRLSGHKKVTLTAKAGPHRVLYLGRHPVAKEDLGAELSRLQAEDGIEGVVINADGTLDLQEALELAEVVQKAGLDAEIGARARRDDEESPLSPRSSRKLSPEEKDAPAP